MILPHGEAMILMVLQFVVLASSAATVVLATLAFAGRRDPALPRCRRCRTDLAAALVESKDACPGCAAPLAAPNALRPRWRMAGPRVWIGLLATLLLSGGAFSLGLARAQSPAGPLAMTAVFGGPIDVIVDEALWNPTAAPAHLHFALSRLRADQVTLDSLRSALIESLRRPDAPAGGPQRRTVHRLAGELLAAQPEDAELLAALIETLEPAPSLRVKPHSRSNQVTLAIERYGRRPDHEAPGAGSADRSIWSTQLVRQVRVNGVPVDARLPGGALPNRDLALSHETFEFVLDGLTEPPREIEVDLDAVILDPVDARRLAGLEYSLERGTSWPTILATTRRTARLVVGGDDSEDGAGGMQEVLGSGTRGAESEEDSGGSTGADGGNNSGGGGGAVRQRRPAGMQDRARGSNAP